MQNAVCKMPNTSKTKQNTYTQGPDCINRHTHWESHTSMHWKNNVHIIQIKNKKLQPGQREMAAYGNEEIESDRARERASIDSVANRTKNG